MVTVRFHTKGSRLCSVEMTGHAGYAEAGYDIVCSAVSSAIMLTDVLLEDILGLSLKTEVDGEIPRIYLELPNKLEDTLEEGAQNALAALMVHMTSLKEDYSDFIEVLEV